MYYIYIYNHRTTHSGSSSGSPDQPGRRRAEPGRAGAADRAGREAAAGTCIVAAAAVRWSMILYIYIHVYYIVVEEVAYFLRKIICSRTVTYLIRNMIFRSRILLFQGS